MYINKNICILYIPTGTQNAYGTTYQWMDFNNIVEFSTSVLDKAFNTNEISFFPNPVTDGFRLIGINEASELSLSDINGKLLLVHKIENNEYVSLAFLPKGIYLVKITSSEKKIAYKLVKK